MDSLYQPTFVGLHFQRFMASGVGYFLVWNVCWRSVGMFNVNIYLKMNSVQTHQIYLLAEDTLSYVSPAD